MGFAKVLYMESIRFEERRDRRIREMVRRISRENPRDIWYDFDAVRRFAVSKGMPDDEAREVQDLFWT